MGQQDFQERLKSVAASKQTASAQAVVAQPPKSSGKPPLRSGLIGAVCSAVVLFLFYTIQEISDLAPEAVKQSDSPGLLGTPVALLAIAWIIIIPLKFVRQSVGFSTKETAPPPTPFTIGAFVVLAMGLMAMQLE